MSNEKTKMSVSTARLFAAVFLLGGLFLGVLDAPALFNRFLARTGVGFEVPSNILLYRLGLDIQGGTHLVYAADLDKITSVNEASSMAALREVLERRVNLFGVSEPIVQVQQSGEEWRLIIELAGVHDVNEAIRLIGETPFLEFRTERPEEDRDAILKDIEEDGPRAGEDPYFIPTPLTGRFLERASVVQGQLSLNPQITLELTADGGDLFADLTRDNIGKPLAIYLDGVPISAPIVQDEITGGRAQITGNFTEIEARILVGRLNAGALPVPITLISQQSVGASLGVVSLERSLYAGMIGFILLSIFMILWYRIPGVLAVLALLFYTALVLALFQAFSITLTLAGVAGFILSIGMAVDANILIFERLKEELRDGNTLVDAIEQGFARAWTSIRDSNVSSLITSAILYWFGTSLVQGFALTLGIGILVSMFSAIYVTKTFLIALGMKEDNKLKWLLLSGFTGSNR